MQCDQCDGKAFSRRIGADRFPDGQFYYHLVCDNCGNIVERGYPCDRCDRLDADLYVAKMRLPRDPSRSLYGHEFKTRRCKIRRCEACAKELPPRWRKKEELVQDGST